MTDLRKQVVTARVTFAPPLDARYFEAVRIEWSKGLIAGASPKDSSLLVRLEVAAAAGTSDAEMRRIATEHLEAHAQTLAPQSRPVVTDVQLSA